MPHPVPRLTEESPDLSCPWKLGCPDARLPARLPAPSSRTVPAGLDAISVPSWTKATFALSPNPLGCPTLRSSLA